MEGRRVLIQSTTEEEEVSAEREEVLMYTPPGDVTKEEEEKLKELSVGEMKESVLVRPINTAWCVVDAELVKVHSEMLRVALSERMAETQLPWSDWRESELKLHPVMVVLVVVVVRGTEMSGLERTVNFEADFEFVKVREDKEREPEEIEKSEQVNEAEEVEEE